MFNKFFLIIIGLIIGTTAPVVQAATRIDTPIEKATMEDPASEKKCLEAFVNSKFSFAFSLCLPLAQKGMRDAQLVTGLMYAFGEGIEKNAEMAELWLKEADRNGSMEAHQVLNDIKMAK